MKWFLICFLFAGCVTAKPKDYSKFREASIRSILVLPVVNNSTEVGAAESMLSTVPIFIGESGYYVFPVNAVKRVLEDENLGDSSLLHKSDPVKLAALFGADAVLYVSIESWTAKYVILSTSVEVDLNFVLKDGRSGLVLWEERRAQAYIPPNTGTGLEGLISAAVNAALTKASPNYVPLAKMINTEVFEYPGPGLLPGPYKKQVNYNRK